MVWFAFLSGPLGTSVRVMKRFLYDFSEEAFDVIEQEKCTSLQFKVINNPEDEELMNLVYMDPDIADLKKQGIKSYVIALYT